MLMKMNFYRTFASFIGSFINAIHNLGNRKGWGLKFFILLRSRCWISQLFEYGNSEQLDECIWVWWESVCWLEFETHNIYCLWSPKFQFPRVIKNHFKSSTWKQIIVKCLMKLKGVRSIQEYRLPYRYFFQNKGIQTFVYQKFNNKLSGILVINLDWKRTSNDEIKQKLKEVSELIRFETNLAMPIISIFWYWLLLLIMYFCNGPWGQGNLQHWSRTLYRKSLADILQGHWYHQDHLQTQSITMQTQKYIVEVSLARQIVVRCYKRYNEFEALYQLITMKYKNYDMGEFPSKFQILSKEETRKQYFQNMLNQIIKDHSHADRLQ